MLDPNSVLNTWWKAARDFATKPFDQDKDWLDFVLVLLISATICFFWNRILEAHIPEA